MEIENNCPLCGQTVGQIAYALDGKAELCEKHHAFAGELARRRRRLAGEDAVHETALFLECVMAALMDPAIERIAPVAATQPPIGRKES
jgi:hypothetical protein